MTDFFHFNEKMWWNLSEFGIFLYYKIYQNAYVCAALVITLHHIEIM